MNISSPAPGIALVLLSALSGACGLLVGVDWDRVAAQSALHDGAPPQDDASDPTAGDAGRDGATGADGGALGDAGHGGNDGGPVTCSSPLVRCISGCCADDQDPGLPNGISAGQSTSCAVTTTGKVRCWGLDNVGQLGRGKGASSAVPVTAYHIPSGASSVALGMVHGCAVVGSLLGCWGANGSGEVGFDGAPTSLGVEEPGRVQNVQGHAMAVSLGTSHSCAVVDGVVYCWGSNDHGELAAPPSTYRSSVPLQVPQVGTGVRAVGAGGVRSCAVLSSGDVACWGGQGGDPPTTVVGVINATQIAVAPFHACALTSKGVSCWGSNLSGELGNNSAGGNTPSTPTGLPSPVTQISAGGSHTCAVAAGSAWCWGGNVSGELGRDTGLQSGLPAAVPGVANVVAVAAGDNHTCALLANHALKCWGSNAEGELGNGTKQEGFLPVDVTWP